MIYLDNNATTEPDKTMLDQVFQQASCYYNPSSLYAEEAKLAIEKARKAVADLLNTEANQVIFTSGGSESNGIALHTKPELGETVICSEVEHTSVYRCGIGRVRVNEDGFINLNHLEDTLKHFSKFRSRQVVAVMLANNETGVITDPTNEVPALCEKYGAELHIDAVQGLGKLGANLNIEELGADTLSISAHKAHGLKGSGALCFKGKPKFHPEHCGGNHEFGLRPGTENQLGICSLGFIAQQIISPNYQKKMKAVKARRDKLEELLADIAEINGNQEHRIHNTSNLYFPSTQDVDILLDDLFAAGICASGKSACSSGMPAPSRVLKAMYGKKSDRPHKSIRISLSVYNTDEEIEEAADIIRDQVAANAKL